MEEEVLVLVADGAMGWGLEAGTAAAISAESAACPARYRITRVLCDASKAVVLVLVAAAAAAGAAEGWERKLEGACALLIGDAFACMKALPEEEEG